MPAINPKIPFYPSAETLTTPSRVSGLRSTRKGRFVYRTPDEISRINRKKRKIRLQKARQIGTHTKAEWESLKAEFNWQCVKCMGESGMANVDKDHIVPLYQRGSSDSIENIQPLCARCNNAKDPDNFNWKEFRRSQL